MKPSQLRERILSQHAELRHLLEELSQLSGRVLAGEAGLEPALHAQGAELQATLLEHMALEDRVLAPALREADAWGDERAARLDREHASQREMLSQVLESLRQENLPVMRLALELRGLVSIVLEDMEHEEKAMLGADLLRDDVVSIDTETG